MPKRPGLSSPSWPAVGYHEYQTLEADVSGRTYAYVSKPGIDRWDRVDDDLELLVEGSDLAEGQRIVCVGCGPGLIGAVIAARLPNAQLTLLDSNLVAIRATERTMALHRLTQARVLLSDGLGAVAGDRFDRVLIDLPKGRALLQQILAQALHVLEPGGLVCLAGGNREGIKSYAGLLAQGFGNASVTRIGGGHRAICATRRAEQGSSPVSDGSVSGFLTTEVKVRDRCYRIVSKPGVFSWERLDDGTRMLLECLEVGAKDQVLDLGCGCGIVGAVAASMAPAGHAYLVDSQIAAIEAARRTTEANGLANATVLLSDVASDVRHLTFDLVATNLPFHLGIDSDHSTALQFIIDAHRVLRVGGSLYLVSNLFLKYEPHVAQAFGNCETVCSDTRFKVLRAKKTVMHARRPQSLTRLGDARLGSGS